MQSEYALQSYCYLANFSGQSLSETDTYYVCRALLILGHKHEFEDTIQKFLSANPSSQNSKTINFLLWQGQVYFENPLNDEDLVVDFDSVCGFQHLKGDFEFVCGYSFLRKNQFRRALRHFQFAHEQYEKLEMPLHTIVAAYNSWVCCHNLGDTNGAVVWSKIVANSQTLQISGDSVKHLQLRSKTYLLIHQSEFREAIKPLRELVEYYSRTARYVDLWDSILSMLFVTFMSDDLKTFEWVENQFSISKKTIEPPKDVAEVVKAFLSLNLVDQIDKLAANELLKNWRNLKVNPVCVLYLHQALCHVLLRLCDFTSLLKVSDQALKVTLENHQISTVFDFKFYRLSSLIAKGSFIDAERELSEYIFVARLQSHKKSQERAKWLSKELDSLMRRNSFQPISEPSTSTLMISLHKLSLQLGDVKIDLTSQPLLFEAVRLIASKDKSMKSADLFQHLYHSKYNPIMHESRINSLIQRLRALFDMPLIIRQNGEVSINKNIRVISDSEINLDDSVASRRERILSVIRSADSPISISEIVSKLGEKRRTLQLDIQTMLKNRELNFHGLRKNRKYYAASL